MKPVFLKNNMLKMKKQVLIIIITLLILSSCNDNNKYIVNVSDINVEIRTKHFEQDLFKFKLDSSEYYINNYRQEYGEFFKIYNYQIIDMGSSEDEHYGKNLDLFVRYWKTEGIFDILKKEFSEFDKKQVPKIENALKHYKYYFPENHIPKFYTFFSSFGYSIITLDSLIGIGLDKYLGKHNFHLYDKVGFSLYQKRRMTKEMIPVDIMESVAKSDYPINKETNNTLLDNMIYEGKIQYYLNCMLPKTHDTLKFRYTTKQLAWANKHEKKVWNYIAEKKMIYTTDQNDIRKFVGDGPYTSVFTDVSAPRAGSYIGYKIVNSYMNKNSEISLKELMENNDGRKILSASKYNP